MALFAEKGYDAVTMTEVAARASTAIGSLYRFFPTKEALAGALLDRYGAHLSEALDAIVARAAEMSRADIAAALIDIVRTLRAERSAVLPLLDVQHDSVVLRAAMRDAMRDRLAAILVRCGSVLGAESGPQAIVLQHLLKMAWALPHTSPTQRDVLEQEVKGLLRLYLEGIGAGRTGVLTAPAPSPASGSAIGRRSRRT